MAKVPEQTHDGNNNRSKVAAHPSAGATRPAGKSDSHEEALGNPGRLKPETVTTIDMSANAGACVKAALVQSQGDGAELNVTNGNPKRRERNAWGIHHGEEK